MNNQLKPFADDMSLVITDKHGNELNVQNDPEKLTIYGQWQGKKDAPEFVSFVSMLTQAQETLKSQSIVSTKEIDGFKITKKKDEILLDVNVDLLKDEDSSGKILKFINKVNKI